MDTSPTALFDSYEGDFRQIIDSIKEKLDGLAKTDNEQQKSTLRRVEMELEEADEMVSQMELEIQGVPPSVRPQYQTRLRTAKVDLAQHKKMLTDSRASLARVDLLSTNSKAHSYTSSDDPYAPSSDRTRLLAGTNLLEEGSKRLQQSQRLALETENQGAEILMNLRTQREQIENSRNTLERADLAIDRASNTLKSMVRRMYQQKAITMAIIAVLILLIVIIVWEKASA